MTSGDPAKPAGRIVLLPPDQENLSGFEAALAAGWSPDPRRAGDAAYIRGELQRLRQDRSRFLDDLIADGRRRAGSASPPLTTRLFWISDGEFCGSISLRFQPGTEELPPDVSGHLGYSVVPWKQRNGHATTALTLLLAVAAEEGLDRLTILCNYNHASRRVIERNGGELFMRGPHSSDRPDQIKLYFWLKPGAAD
ncbi:GNAT family N-acetyltransferase [Rhizobium sp. L43]|uniref:GNAT family N-acetyltransferase n=1 Tax=Rhizobium sp. L43 TaxID=2035452 RepID=UPI000BE8617E|nr:GNAT family N-acetyltransferase [Rhizobium sp. L43]PDS77928.1 GNAT family N-acetyltransferase [Rhizobium sp. L43]